MQCPRCDGSGKCVECDGQGSLECATCSGSGERTTSRGLSYKCKGCSGTGRTDCPKECSSCGGVGEITEELQNETREKYRPKFVDFGPSRHLTTALLIVNLAVYFLSEVEPGFLGALVLYREGVAAGFYWTFVTSSFVHYYTYHIVCNMIFLWFYGPVVEGILGKFKYLSVYLFCALTAGLVSYFGNVVFEQGDYAGIGASGPLFGLVGYLYAVHIRWKLPEAADAPRLARIVGIVLLVGFAISIAGTSWLDNWGHLGGLWGGLMAGVLLPRPKK